MGRAVPELELVDRRRERSRPEEDLDRVGRGALAVPRGEPRREHPARRVQRGTCERGLVTRRRQASGDGGDLAGSVAGGDARAPDGGVVRVQLVEHLSLARGQLRVARARGSRAGRAHGAGGRDDQCGHAGQPHPAQRGMRRHRRTLAKTVMRRCSAAQLPQPVVTNERSFSSRTASKSVLSIFPW